MGHLQIAQAKYAYFHLLSSFEEPSYL